MTWVDQVVKSFEIPENLLICFPGGGGGAPFLRDQHSNFQLQDADGGTRTLLMTESPPPVFDTVE